eukprot:g2989.t1
MAAVGLKIGILFVKTVVKPLAKRIKTAAEKEGSLRRYCIQYGQFHHRVESSLTLRLAGHHATRIKPLADDKAMALGADVFSEALIYVVGSLAIVYELRRKDKEDSVKKAKQQAQEQREQKELSDRFRRIEDECTRLRTCVEQQTEQLTALTQELLTMRALTPALDLMWTGRNCSNHASVPFVYTLHRKLRVLLRAGHADCQPYDKRAFIYKPSRWTAPATAAEAEEGWHSSHNPV